jgi:WD40 repeat protein
VRVLPPGSPVALDEGGRLLAAGGALWPTDGGPRVRGLGTVRVLGPDGRRALVDRQGRLEIAATATGEALAALHGADPLRRAFAEELASGSFSPDGERLLVRQDDRAGLWDATSGEPIARLGARGDTVEALAFGDGGRLALATVSTRAAVYSSADGKLVRAVEGSFARGAISPDGLLAAVPRGDGSLDVVDLVTGARTTLGTDTAAALTSVLFGPTSDLLVARDEAGDVHVVGCEICAPEEELLALARSRLAEVTRIEASRPPVSAIG